MAGKGDKERPPQVDRDTVRENHDRIFGPKCCFQKMRDVTSQETATWGVKIFLCEKCKKAIEL